MSDVPKVQSGVTTTQQNVIQLRPFDIVLVETVPLWDPTDGPLPLTYTIVDPNQLIQNGKIVYRVPGPDGRVTAYTDRLSGDRLQPGLHVLDASQQWDGTTQEGLPDRQGEKVTADLSRINIIITAWNTAFPEPAPFVEDGTGSGKTQRAGEFVATGYTSTAIDAIVLAKWSDHRVIPYDDPEEPDLGHAQTIVHVKNVKDGTPAHIAVFRTNSIADPSSDFPYADESSMDNPEDQAEATQPGLQDLVVRGQKIVRQDGSRPFVRFNNYDEHWLHEGNNFYCFTVAFDQGNAMTASERDYVNNEPECLHMRFTVYIHVSATDLPQYVAVGRALHQWLRGSTKYWRSYLGSPTADLQHFFRRFRFRYVVIMLSHGRCTCDHPDHPLDANGNPMDPYHNSFPPDRGVCPDQVYDTSEAQALIAEARQHYHHDFGGCGNTTNVRHGIKINAGPVLLQLASPFITGDDQSKEGYLPFIVGPDGGQRQRIDADFNRFGPRAMFFNGGCRSILSSNMGDGIVAGKSHYYTGWRYSPQCDYGFFVADFFRTWIKGSNDEPAETEYDIYRVVPGFLECAARGTRPSWHARIMDMFGVYPPQQAPDTIENALS